MLLMRLVSIFIIKMDESSFNFRQLLYLLLKPLSNIVRFSKQ